MTASRRSRQQLPHVGDPAGDCRRRRRRRADEMRSYLRTLAVLEIAIGGRHAALTGLAAIAIAASAHRAAGFAPEEARLAEDLVEPGSLRFALHGRGAGDHHGHDAFGDAP